MIALFYLASGVLFRPMLLFPALMLTLFILLYFRLLHRPVEGRQNMTKQKFDNVLYNMIKAFLLLGSWGWYGVGRRSLFCLTEGV